MTFVQEFHFGIPVSCRKTIAHKMDELPCMPTTDAPTSEFALLPKGSGLIDRKLSCTPNLVILRGSNFPASDHFSIQISFSRATEHLLYNKEKQMRSSRSNRRSRDFPNGLKWAVCRTYNAVEELTLIWRWSSGLGMPLQNVRDLNPGFAAHFDGRWKSAVVRPLTTRDLLKRYFVLCHFTSHGYGSQFPSLCATPL